MLQVGVYLWLPSGCVMKIFGFTVAARLSCMYFMLLANRPAVGRKTSVAYDQLGTLAASDALLAHPHGRAVSSYEPEPLKDEPMSWDRERRQVAVVFCV
jgi:hypothetical protein